MSLTLAIQNPFEGTAISALRILIASHANWEGISRLPCLLSQADCSVDLVSPVDTFITHSSYVSTHFAAPQEMSACLTFLQTHLVQHGDNYAWVIVGDDPLLCALGKRRSETWARQLLPCLADDRAIDFLVSKLDFLVQAKAAGLPLPEFFLYEDQTALLAAADSLGYPLVVKQREGFGGKTVSIVSDLAALKQLSFDDSVIAQAFIPGPLGSAAAYFDHGRLVGFFSYFRHRTWGQKGASTAVSFHSFEGLESMLEALGKNAGFHGLCGVDFIQHAQTGKVVLLEQNFRPTLTVLLGRRAGVDLSALIQQTLAGIHQALPVRQKAMHGAPSVPLFPIDILRAIDERDVRGFLRWLVKPSYWSEMNWHDRRLLAYHVRYVSGFLFNKVKRLWS